MIETLEEIGGRPLAPGQGFAFRCGPDLACFGSCCADKRLPLWPYDLLRLRRALARPSQDILAELVELETDPRSGWPALRLRLNADGRCPFSGPGGGCQVYAHRPLCCRIYPLARAVAPAIGGGQPRQVFIVQDAPACLGLGQPRALDQGQWLADQGMGPYLAANNRLLGLLMHPRRPARLALTPAQTHAYLAALYNLDVFRQQVRDPAFAKRAGLEKARVKKALRADESLLELGQDWLSQVLFG
ncbi:protein of unknown function UPF0153 [Desulfarculus baarsii DSM 2075]|uniref:YkgJ family cysteine cluster protein n=1 Tax=Desulfarculus baarsii (strain ATCC 33931 / DSM 2075 / LMG 7858 / VKM B-1802 / 2st14) TaxID=644282 RepID=E1QDK1_DESB2|nr:YkgJ family cysteine cluster protein [Desulfarculus baarsii]ADK83520.1 protein of unknown function UPF0153 [Desulfarculus baarsii DSM 2075]